MKFNEIWKILKEYKLSWCFYRMIYVLKIKFLKINKNFWKLFEHKVNIKDIDLFDIDVERLELFFKNVNVEEKKQIILLADQANEGKIYSFSKNILDYGNPIQWNYNPVTKKCTNKNNYWFEIPDFNENIGDIKLIWEPSRFCYLYLLSRAYIITKNKKYYEAFSNQIENWNKDNKYPYGVNYKCGQEAAIRMINILMNYSVFKRYDLIQDKDIKNIKEIVEASYKKLLSNFFYAEKCVKNNHTISELIGLMVGAWCEKDEKKQKKYNKKFKEQLKKQFKKDGGYIQYSFNYQRLVCQMIEIFLKMHKKMNFELEDEVKKIINNCIMHMYHLQTSDGYMPNYGSNDGAYLMPVNIRGYQDYASSINTLYAMLNSKLLYDDFLYKEELIWFEVKDDLVINNIEKTSKEFRNIGIYSLRDEEKYMMIICPKFKNRPTQMDVLHFDLWYKNFNVLCDSGTYSYANNYDKEFAMTKNHNTVKVDELEQMNKKGPFLYYDWTKCKSANWSENEFKGKIYSNNGKYFHERKIRKTNEGFEITDKVKSKKDAKKCYIYLHSQYETELIEKNRIIIKNSSNFLCEINFKQNINMRKIKKFSSIYYYDKMQVNEIEIEKDFENNICEFDYEIKFK